MNELSTIISLIAPSGKPHNKIDYYSFNQPSYSNDLLLFAQTEEVFKQELENITHNILWAVRGGYGSYRFSNIDFQHKTLIGYSDITYLFLTNSSIKHKIHAAHFCDQFLNKNPTNFEFLKNVLQTQNYSWKIPLKYSNLELTNTINGKIIGGNLTLITKTIGIIPVNSFANKILVLEDIGEPPHDVHRNLIHLKKAGYFKDIKGIIKGTFLSLEQQKNDSEEIYEEIFKEIFQDIPLFFTDHIGHGYNNIPFIYNQEITINDSHIFLNNSTLL